MRNYDELGLIAHLANEIIKAAHVRLIERRIHFIEYAERTGLVLEDTDQQRQSGKRLFSAGEQQHILQLLAWRRSHDVDSALRGVLYVGEAHEALASTKKFAEGDLKIFVDLGERLFEFLSRDNVDLFNGALRVLDGFEQ